MTFSLDRARADHEAGRLWKARDRLQGLLRDRQDTELLDLLATVHFEMRDLPAAGALWFVTGRNDERADLAIAAWRQRRGGDEARWTSLPAPVRRGTLPPHLKDLRRAARREAARARREVDRSDVARRAPWRGGVARAVGTTICVVVVVSIPVGLWTMIRWIVG